jgi:hypothetical protein
MQCDKNNLHRHTMLFYQSSKEFRYFCLRTRKCNFKKQREVKVNMGRFTRGVTRDFVSFASKCHKAFFSSIKAFSDFQHENESIFHSSVDVCTSPIASGLSFAGIFWYEISEKLVKKLNLIKLKVC